MATRSENFRFEQEIHHGADKPKMDPKPPRKRAAHTKTNRYSDTGAHATYHLEISATERPSRKSTRRTSNHIKNDSQLQRRQLRKTKSPKARATMAAAKRIHTSGRRRP